MATLGQLRGEVAPQFELNTGTPFEGTGTGVGSGTGTNVGIQTGVPVSTTSGGSTTSGTTTPAASNAGFFSSLLNSMGCSIADALLRIAFFILGLIAIIGAIYLYKGNNTVLKLPGKIIRGTVRAGATAARAAARGEE